MSDGFFVNSSRDVNYCDDGGQLNVLRLATPCWAGSAPLGTVFLR